MEEHVTSMENVWTTSNGSSIAHSRWAST